MSGRGNLLIRGGRVADGTGAALDDRDIVVTGDRIEATTAPGAVTEPGGYRVLDSTGLTVAPGFIDVHSHADNAPLLADDDTTKILQGVTTEVVGNCGFSLAPARTESPSELRALTGRIFPELPWTWSGFASLLEATDAAGYVTNFVPLVGHGTLRVAVLGFADRPATSAECRDMSKLLAQALDAGACGFSSGLIYPPGMFSTTGELAELAATLPPTAIYATHMRGEGAELDRSVAEALEVGRRGSCRVQISHLKSAGAPNWGGVPRALAQLDAGTADGVQVTQDVYPYTASSTMLTACLPRWFQEGGDRALLARLEAPEQLRLLRSDIDSGDPGTEETLLSGAGYEGILIATTASGARVGRTLAEIAGDEGIEPFEVLVRVLRDERLRASMVAFSMCEEDLQAALRHPATMIGSDGLPPGNGGRPHPRLFGTFPRVLGRYVRERGVLDLPTAIHRMTGLPAATFNLRDRGVIRPGAVADLVAFDPATVRDVGDYRDPVHAPAGITWVMQHGEIVVAEGQWLGSRQGQRLHPR